MKIDFWNNPLVIHAFESSAGRRKLWSIVLGQPLLLLALYALLSEWQPAAVTPQSCLVALIGWELVAGVLGALLVTGAAITSDVKQRTLESLKLTALTPAQLLLGKMLAEPAAIYLSVWATLPLASVFGIASGVNIGWIILAYVNISAIMLLGGSVALLQPFESIGDRPGTLSPGQAMIAIVMLIGLQGAIGGYMALIQQQGWQATLDIFAVPVPILLFIPIASLFLAATFFRIAVRRLTLEVLPPVGKPMAYGLLGVSDLLAAGILFGVPIPFLGLAPRLAIFWLVHMGVSSLLLLAGTPNRQALLSWTWRFRTRRSRALDLLLFDRSPNDLLAAGFAVMGVVNALIFIVLPLVVQNAWPADAPAMIFAATASIAAVTLGLGALTQWLGFVGRQALASVIFCCVMLLILPQLVVEAPLLFHEPPYPDWIGGASPAYHIGRWLAGLPSDNRALVLLFALYVGIFVCSTWWFHLRLGRLAKAVDQRIRDMGYRGH
jgi:hypothetical protein